MKTATTLPAYTPAQPYCDHIVGYANRIKNYGNPPAGYRWLKVGEKIPDGSIYANYHGKQWRESVSANAVEDTHYAFAAPIIPELIPDDPSAAVALEVVGRDSKVARFKIARQSDAVKYGELFKASNKLQIESVWEPQILFSHGYPHGKFYLRGDNKRNDDSILSCTPKRFERIVAALAEYNASLTPKAEAPKTTPVSSDPPKYTGPTIERADNLNEGMAKAGPAPKGWRYVTTSEKMEATDFILHENKWSTPKDSHYSGWVGHLLSKNFWPVIRRVEPCSPPKSPESIIAELQSEIATLKAKVAEQAKALGKIKKIVS